MVITTTGVVFSISSLGLILCGFWFFKAFQKIGGLRSGSRVGILLSVFFLSLAFEHALLAFGGLFFATMPDALYAILVVNHFILAVAAALGTYLAFYILFPKISSWPATFMILAFGFFGTALTIFTHPQPFIDANNSIDWNMQRPAELSIYFLLMLSLVAPILIFMRNLFQSVSRDVKIVSFIIVLTHSLGMINVSILFSGLFYEEGNLRTDIFDKVLGVIGILFIVGFLVIPFVTGWVSKITNNKNAQ